MERSYASSMDGYPTSLDEGSSRDGRLTDLQDTISGALAWLVATWLTQPLEMVRMHQQLGTSIGNSGAIAGGLTLLKSRGGMFRGTWIGWMKTLPESLVKRLVLRSLRSGGSSGAFGSLPGRVAGATNLISGAMTNTLSSQTGGHSIGPEPTLSGLLPRLLATTISARLITYPFEVCKLRVMQYEGPKPYSGLWDTGRRIVIEEGVTGLFKGLSMGLAANVVYSMTMAIVCPWTHSFAAQFGVPAEISMYVSRLISMFTSYPFETVKRRLASNCQWVPLTSLPSSTIDHNSPLKLFKHMFKTNWMQLWAGFPVLAISFVLKSLLVRTTQHALARFFMWNNGYTVSIFDSTPLKDTPQFIGPDDLIKRRRWDARA